jgi:hypothetical protein
MRHAGARVRLREHHVVGTQPFEDAGVFRTHRFGPDLRYLDVQQVSGDQHTGLEMGPHAHHGYREVPGANLL